MRAAVCPSGPRVQCVARQVGYVHAATALGSTQFSPFNQREPDRALPERRGTGDLRAQLYSAFG